MGSVVLLKGLFLHSGNKGGLGWQALVLRSLQPLVPTSPHHFLTRWAIILMSCWWKNKYHLQTPKTRDPSCVVLIQARGRVLTHKFPLTTTETSAGPWRVAFTDRQASWATTFYIDLCVQQHYELPSIAMPERGLWGDRAVQFPSAKTLLSQRWRFF